MTNQRFDPTKNTTCNGLLSDEDVAALAAWPHGWEMFSDGVWVDWQFSCMSRGRTYRGKPAPVTRDRWAFSELDKKYRWQARSDQLVSFSDQKMELVNTYGFFTWSAKNRLLKMHISFFDQSFFGTCDWKDSQIERPEGV